MPLNASNTTCLQGLLYLCTHFTDRCLAQDMVSLASLILLLKLSNNTVYLIPACLVNPLKSYFNSSFRDQKYSKLAVFPASLQQLPLMSPLTDSDEGNVSNVEPFPFLHKCTVIQYILSTFIIFIMCFTCHHQFILILCFLANSYENLQIMILKWRKQTETTPTTVVVTHHSLCAA